MKESELLDEMLEGFGPLAYNQELIKNNSEKRYIRLNN